MGAGGTSARKITAPSGQVNSRPKEKDQTGVRLKEGKDESKRVNRGTGTIIGTHNKGLLAAAPGALCCARSSLGPLGQNDDIVNIAKHPSAASVDEMQQLQVNRKSDEITAIPLIGAQAIAPFS